MSKPRPDRSALDDELLMASVEDDAVRLLLGRYDVPAYVRRGLRVEAAIRDFFADATRLYRELLEPVLACARALARQLPGPDALACHFPEPGEQHLIQSLYRTLLPTAPWRGSSATHAHRSAHAAAERLRAALVRFNRRWQAQVAELDYAAVNREIDGYNRYYLIEKECALRSRKLAARGFRPLERITPATVLERLPILEPGTAVPEDLAESDRSTGQ